MKIRIIAGGVFGLPPTDENPTGEYPVGHEFETSAKLPEGWKGKYHVVEHGAVEGSTAITNPANGGGAGEGESGPLDGSIDDLTTHIESVTDVDAIQKLIDDETAGKSRAGAIKALEKRRDELLAA
jgi:hypothetical protein